MTPSDDSDPIIRPPDQDDTACAVDQAQVWDVSSCVDCGYDLTANETGICPECGHVLKPDRFDPQPFQRQVSIHAGCLAAIVFLAHVLAALVFSLTSGFTAILGFTFTYSVGVGVAVFLVTALSIAVERPHHRLRVRYLFYCTAGWYFWPIAALPLAVVIGVVVGNATASMVSLFALCAIGAVWYIVRWRRLCARMPLPVDSRGALLQLIAFLVGSVVLPTGLLAFAVLRLGPN